MGRMTELGLVGILSGFLLLLIVIHRWERVEAAQERTCLLDRILALTHPEALQAVTAREWAQAEAARPAPENVHEAKAPEELPKGWRLPTVAQVEEEDEVQEMRAEADAGRARFL